MNSDEENPMLYLMGQAILWFDEAVNACSYIP